MRKLIAVALSMCLLSTSIVVAAPKQFKDVPSNHWAYPQIMNMYNKGIISGDQFGNFNPNSTITRAEFAKIMVNVAGIEVTQVKVKSFDDVTLTDWYTPYIEAARSYLTGFQKGNTFYYKPNDPALREDIAIAMVKLKKIDPNTYTTAECEFTDFDTVSDVAKPYVRAAKACGLIGGYPDGTFKPFGSLTRAESASLLGKLIEEKETKVILEATPSPMPTPKEEKVLMENVEEPALPRLNLKPNSNGDIITINNVEELMRSFMQYYYGNKYPGLWFTYTETYHANSKYIMVGGYYTDNEKYIPLSYLVDKKTGMVYISEGSNNPKSNSIGSLLLDYDYKPAVKPTPTPKVEIISTPKVEITPVPTCTITKEEILDLYTSYIDTINKVKLKSEYLRIETEPDRYNIYLKDSNVNYFTVNGKPRPTTYRATVLLPSLDVVREELSQVTYLCNLNNLKYPKDYFKAHKSQAEINEETIRSAMLNFIRKHHVEYAFYMREDMEYTDLYYISKYRVDKYSGDIYNPNNDKEKVTVNNLTFYKPNYVKAVANILDYLK